jgi:DNA-directed RNA polymerase sigma subunit (sigma70/sigma32)
MKPHSASQEEQQGVSYQTVLFYDVFSNAAENLLTAFSSKGDFDEVVDIALDTLTKQERDFILMFYRDKMSRAEIGRRLCLTVPKLKQIEGSALRNLRLPSSWSHLSPDIRYGLDVLETIVAELGHCTDVLGMKLGCCEDMV